MRVGRRHKHCGESGLDRGLGSVLELKTALLLTIKLLSNFWVRISVRVATSNVISRQTRVTSTQEGSNCQTSVLHKYAWSVTLMANAME